MFQKLPFNYASTHTHTQRRTDLAMEESLPETLQKLGLRPVEGENDLPTDTNNAPSRVAVETNDPELVSSSSSSATIMNSFHPVNPFFGQDLLIFQSTLDRQETAAAATKLCPIEELPSSNCSATHNEIVITNRSRSCLDCCEGEVENQSEEEESASLQRKKLLYRNCLEDADRKWTFFQNKSSPSTSVIINRRPFKSHSRSSSLLRAPILKLNRIPSELRNDDALTRTVTFTELQSRYRSNSHEERQSVDDPFDLQLLDPERILRMEEAATTAPPAGPFSEALLLLSSMAESRGELTAEQEEGNEEAGTSELHQQQQQPAQSEGQSLTAAATTTTCSQQAALLTNCDVTIDELASYFETFVHIPKKMSSMAEMMYTWGWDEGKDPGSADGCK